MSCDLCPWGTTKNSGCSFDYVCNTNGREAPKKDVDRPRRDKREKKEEIVRPESYTQPIYQRKKV